MFKTNNVIEQGVYLCLQSRTIFGAFTILIVILCDIMCRWFAGVLTVLGQKFQEYDIIIDLQN